jgi:hypothetical protein
MTMGSKYTLSRCKHVLFKLIYASILIRVFQSMQWLITLCANNTREQRIRTTMVLSRVEDMIPAFSTYRNLVASMSLDYRICIAMTNMLSFAKCEVLLSLNILSSTYQKSQPCIRPRRNCKDLLYTIRMDQGNSRHQP